MSAVRFSDKDEIILFSSVSKTIANEPIMNEHIENNKGSERIDNNTSNCIANTSVNQPIPNPGQKDGRFTIKQMHSANNVTTNSEERVLSVKGNINDKEEQKDDSSDDDENVQEYNDYQLMNRPSVFDVVTSYKGGIIQPPNDQTKSRRLGTLLGVYFPCIQNILGVIVFIRYPWIIGVSGISGALLICSICSLCTLLTAISMSAIATNGRVPAGGSYFMISRSLGPAVGGAVGILFYIANSLSCAMYTIGAVEILIKYICPKQCLLFGDDVEDAATAFNHYRIYGAVLLILLTIIVLIGIRFVSVLAPISLFCVLISILCIYIGLIKAAFTRPNVPICVLQNLHLLKSNVLNNDIPRNCIANSTLLQNITCGTNSSLCPLVKYTKIYPGINGLSDSQFVNNWGMNYRSEGEVAPGVPALDRMLEVYAIQLTNFFILIGIYFPSVTGIMAGSNRSGDLKDPSVSIPKGTIGAIITTSLIYITYALLVGSSVDGRLLRDKFGDSIDKSLVIAMVAWPNKWVILIGALLSTIGAGLQTLTGAPRIIQALANDDVIKFLNIIGHSGRSGEPRRAILLTTGIAFIGVLIADIDQLTPLLSMFFLLCYGFVNLACALQSLLGTPNWRPTFKYYHWTLSLLGLALCLAIMFMASWYFALIAVAIAIIVYKYIEYKGAEKEWGDGLTGLQLSAALYALSRLEEDKDRHYRNWRPELLVLEQKDFSSNRLIDNGNILALARQMKAGGGLVIVGTVHITNDYFDDKLKTTITEIKQMLAGESKKNHLNSFHKVVAAKTLEDGIYQLIQTSGLGGMKPNTLIIPWPSNWKGNQADIDIWNITSATFLKTLKIAERNTLAVIIPKNISMFPTKKNSKLERKSTTIDIWWILHDAGLMLLIAYLLRKHRIWKQCSLRIFTVSESTNDAVLARSYIKNVTQSIRIPVQHIEVVLLESSDLSAYAYDRTVELEHGNKLLKELNKQRRALIHHVDCQFTFTPVAGGIMNLQSCIDNQTTPAKRVHSALKLNQALKDHSNDASLIIVNLPPSPSTQQAEDTYMSFIEVLTHDLTNPILMMRGTGRELITSVN